MNKKIDLGCCIFIFCALFIPDILLLFSYLIWMLYLLLKKKYIFFFKNSIYLYIILGILIIYSTLIIGINQTNDWNMIIRLIRCLVSVVIIQNYIYYKKIDENILFNSIITVLLMHAISIIISIIVPDFKDFLTPINQYSKKFLRYRATGLVSGYDFAGFYTNIGFILINIRKMNNKQSIISFLSLIFAIATIFTSRFNMVILICLILFLLFYSIKKLFLKNTLELLLILLPILILVGFMYILTTDVGQSYRFIIFSKYPWTSEFYEMIVNTYSDASFKDTFSEHFSIEDGINIIFGGGYKPLGIDPGIINNIYRVGIVGLSISLLFYIYILRKLYYLKRHQNTFYYPLFLLIIFTLIMEFKLVFMLSRGVFELTMIIYFSMLKTKSCTKIERC